MAVSVLFVCTGNYYRSRFAEYFFMHEAQVQGQDWQAFSRGFAPNAGNVGPISPYARFALEKLEIKVDLSQYPQALREEDLQRASHIIALKEAEHRPMVQLIFPKWEDKLQFWHIDDLDVAPPEIALPQLIQNVKDLLRTLRQG
ncbi:MAG: low molecular weight phosphatase family protein [Microscillaceae bacterium]|nr:low molecular weight phosphatase family protein [Microscillaceae bacterium]